LPSGETWESYGKSSKKDANEQMNSLVSEICMETSDFMQLDTEESEELEAMITDALSDDPDQFGGFKGIYEGVLTEWMRKFFQGDSPNIVETFFENLKSETDMYDKLEELQQLYDDAD
jgi:hypothetical protein